MVDLSMERLEELLADAPLGRPCRFQARTGSTNDDAIAWLKAGAPQGSLVVADAQRAGRGRMGRAWQGGEGRSILASFILRPAIEASGLGLLGGAVAVALVRAVRDETGVSAGTKWPNDVWIRGRKVAGMLIEAFWEGTILQGAVVGIGLNVNQTADDLPRETRTPATSLRIESGRTWDRGRLLRRIADEMAESLDSMIRHPRRLVGRWQDMETTVAMEVEVSGEGRSLRGIVKGLFRDGSLWLVAGDVERRIAWGEASVRPASGKEG